MAEMQDGETRMDDIRMTSVAELDHENADVVFVYPVEPVPVIVVKENETPKELTEQEEKEMKERMEMRRLVLAR